MPSCEMKIQIVDDLTAQGTIEAISERASQDQTEGQRLAAWSRLQQHPDQPETATAMARKNQRCHPPAAARKLKAAPGFSTWTKLKKGVIGWDQPKGVVASIELLAAWSAARTTKASENQGACRLGYMFTCLEWGPWWVPAPALAAA